MGFKLNWSHNDRKYRHLVLGFEVGVQSIAPNEDETTHSFPPSEKKERKKKNIQPPSFLRQYQKPPHPPPLFLDLFLLQIPNSRSPFAPIPNCLQHHKTTNKPLINLHHRRTIIKYVTIVWRTEQRDQFSLIEKLVSILNDLVAPTYEIHVMFG